MRRDELARRIDHTLLDPLATPGQVAMFLGEANELAVGAVCVAPARLPLPVGALPPHVGVAAVVGFPSGAHRPAVKAAEARLAVEAGATELDLVIDLGLAKAGLWVQVEAEVAMVRHAAPAPVVLKVIIEAAALPGDLAVQAACRAAEAASADYVKTSTGFHPAGGATLHHVALMAATVDGRLGVKAAGGIRDAATALAMLDAGATRLGCSATRAILDGC